MHKIVFAATILTVITLSGFTNRPEAPKLYQNNMSYGYLDKGDSIEWH